MTNRMLYTAWALLFIICAGLGFIPGYSAEVNSLLQSLLTVLSVLFFLPPALLLYRAHKDGDTSTIRLVRNFAALSLALTAAALVLNFLSVMNTTLMGDILFSILIILSAPMVCSGYWVLSLFLWACLLMASLQLLKKK